MTWLSFVVMVGTFTAGLSLLCIGVYHLTDWLIKHCESWRSARTCQRIAHSEEFYQARRERELRRGLDAIMRAGQQGG